MTQIRIADDGGLEDQPRTWDDEPLWSVETVAEGLFSTDAFKQMDGQTAMDTEVASAKRLHCLICGQTIQADERYVIVSREHGEAEHAACTRSWITRNYGAEDLS